MTFWVTASGKRKQYGTARWLRFIFLFCLCQSLLEANQKNIDPILIQGVILTSDADTVDQEDASVYQGVHFRDLSVPGNPLRLKTKLRQTLIGKPITQETLADGKRVIQDFYRKQGHPLVIISIPEQKITQGILQLNVQESRIDAIHYKGNHWFSKKQLQRSIHQRENDTFDANLAQKDLIWLNRNPFRETALVLSPGEEENTTTLTFVSKDQRPFRVYVGTDNTGYRTTGRGRFFVGVHLGNLFQVDQRLSYRYTVSTEFGSFFAHTGQYVIPLPWRHFIEFYGGYSSIRALMPQSEMISKGRAWQASMRYLIPLVPVRSYNHQVKWGIDYKETNVNLVLGAVPILGNRAVITQLMLGYEGSAETPAADLSFGVEGFVSPGDIFRDQGSSDYGSLRPKAKSRYSYLRAHLTPLIHLPASFQMALKSVFQVADRNLLASEQFGLGGLDTVRGYDERILNTDNALLVSAEFRTPPMRPFTKRSKNPKPELLQFLAFVDYGLGVNHNKLAMERDYRYLLGVGLGTRYYYSYHVNVRIDLGYPLHRHIAANIVQKPGMRLNFSVVASF